MLNDCNCAATTNTDKLHMAIGINYIEISSFSEQLLGSRQLLGTSRVLNLSNDRTAPTITLAFVNHFISIIVNKTTENCNRTY